MPGLSSKKGGAGQRFSGKAVLITGGTSGIGEAAAEAFAREGAAIAFCGRETDLGEEVLKRLTGLGAEALFVPADVRSPDEMLSLVGDAVRAFGGLDIALNAAAINNPPNRAGDIPLEEYRDVMATNLDGVFYAMKAELGAMGKGGVIINMASILSDKVSGWMAAYSVSKMGVLALSQSAAEDYRAKGIRVYALSPGPTDTPMFRQALRDIKGDPGKYAGGLPEGRGPFKPAEVAEKILDLADPESAPPTGTNVVIEP